MSRVSDTSATWSVSGTSTPFVLTCVGRSGEAAFEDRTRCSNSQTSPTISCRSALSSRATWSRRTSPSSTRRVGTASSSSRRARGPTFVVKQAGPRSADTLRARGRRAPRARPRCRSWRARCQPSCITSRRHAGWSCARPPAPATGPTISGRFPRIPARTLGRTLADAAPAPGATRSSAPPGATGCGGSRSPSRRTSCCSTSAPAAQELVARVQAEPRPVPPPRASCGSDVPPTTRSCTATSAGTNCLALAAPGVAPPDARCCSSTGSSPDAGPAAFDVGTVLAEYLRAWVGSIPIVEPARSRPARRSRTSSACDAHAARDAGASGRPTGRHPAVPAASPARRRARAVRLLQTAVERAQGLAAPRRARRDACCSSPTTCSASPTKRRSGCSGCARERWLPRSGRRALGAVTIRGPTRLRRGSAAVSRALPAARGRRSTTPRAAATSSRRCGRSSTRRSSATVGPVPARGGRSRAASPIPGSRAAHVAANTGRGAGSPAGPSSGSTDDRGGRHERAPAARVPVGDCRAPRA